MSDVLVKEIKVPHGNWEIDGILYLPQKAGKFPAVIFSHGYNGYKMDFDETARALAEHEVAAFCYTFCGGSTRDTSGMSTTEMTIFTERENLATIIEYVRQLEQVDKNNLFAFGGSQGGLVTALTCDDRSDDIKGMMLLYPAFCIPDNWTERFPSKEDIPKEVEFWGMKLGRKFFENIHGMDVFEYVGKYQNKVLIMHGDKDAIVELGYSETLATIYPQVCMEVFEGEGHGFSPEGTKRMTQMVYEFVKENCF